MKILKNIIVLILVALSIFTLTSGTQVKTFASSSIDFNNGKISNIAVIFFRTDDPYTMRLMESLKNIEKENKNTIKFTFFDSKNNLAIQNQILASAIQDNYDLIILDLVDKKENTVEDTINRVKQKNIPLILINLPTEVASRVSKLYDKIAFVMPDSKQAGIAQGKILVDLWNSNKNFMDINGDNILQYVLLQGPSDDPQAIDRTKYAISTINNLGIKTQELALIHANWLKELAKSSIDNLFLKYNRKIEAIISNNDVMAIGAIEALQNYGYNKGDKLKNIIVVGIDGLPEAKDLIDKGLMAGTIIQDPNVAAELLYTVGINLINNLKPTENINYNIVDGEIIIPFPYDSYTGKPDNP
jgi:methyl-galactoside transport system substrate-binding protein